MNEFAFKKKPIYSFFKRFFDIILSLIGIIVLSWLFIIIAIIIKLTSKGPVFYVSYRIGKNRKPFKIYKFRSMVDGAENELEKFLERSDRKGTFKLKDDPRITKFGKFLRKTSLDELPQLINILIGNMSIVGWRPIVADEVELYHENKELLFKVKPGLTGYWASHGRSDIEYDKRIKMELYYCVKRSLWLDIRIIWHTALRTVFKSEEAK